MPPAISISSRRRAPRGPSVMDIARQIGEFEAKTWTPRFDPPGVAIAPAAQRDLDTILDHMDSLRNLAFNIPPANLADAVAHLVLASREMANLEDYLTPSAECYTIYRKIARTLAGAVPIVAAAAGVNLVSIDADWQVFAKDHKFPSLAASG